MTRPPHVPSLLRSLEAAEPTVSCDLTDVPDEVVDASQLELLELVARHSLDSEVALSLGLIARYYERIADHGVAFARDAAFVGTGERVKT